MTQGIINRLSTTRTRDVVFVVDAFGHYHDQFLMFKESLSRTELAHLDFLVYNEQDLSNMLVGVMPKFYVQSKQYFESVALRMQGFHELALLGYENIYYFDLDCILMPHFNVGMESKYSVYTTQCFGAVNYRSSIMGRDNIYPNGGFILGYGPNIRKFKGVVGLLSDWISFLKMDNRESQLVDEEYIKLIGYTSLPRILNAQPQVVAGTQLYPETDAMMYHYMWISKPSNYTCEEQAQSMLQIIKSIDYAPYIDVYMSIIDSGVVFSDPFVKSVEGFFRSPTVLGSVDNIDPSFKL